MNSRTLQLAACVIALLLIASSGYATERITRGNLVMEGIPELPEQLRERLQQYQNTRSAAFADWAPDGHSMLISTRFAETAQLHRLDQPMGARQQLTFFKEPIYGGSYRPVADQRQIALLRDLGGDENYQVYVFDEADGNLRMISDGSQRKIAAVWSKDGSRLSWSTTIKGSPDWGIVVADVQNPDSRKMVYRGQGAYVPLQWAGDKRRLLVQKYISIVASELFMLDTETGELQQINPADRAIAYDEAKISPDDQAVYYTSNEHGQFLDLVRYQLSDGQQTVLTADIDWDVEGFDLAENGQLLAYSVNAGGRSQLHLRRIDNEPLATPQLPAGIISDLTFSPDSQQLAMTFNTATSPGDVWSYALDQVGLQQWTRSEVGGLDSDSFVEPVFFQYPTFDQRQIPAFIYKPETAGPHPVVIAIHGGPEGQARPGFSSTYQHWVNELGIAVVVPNVRGSSGYGTDYLLLDNGKKREDSVKDIGALLDWVAAQPDLNQQRVMVFGGSYGGYMVLAAMTHFNERLAGAVDIVGISNFVTFLENTQDYRRELRRVEYGDESDPDMRRFLQSIAPLNHAEKITRPLFIIQGANDPRVPASEAEQMLARIKSNGAQPWFLLAQDEGHGFRKQSNRDFMNAAVALFYQQHLLP
ncbi:MAG: S9 family peptidase [Gammaproteobacteria bacterium]|nr:S9 family peptidase [Gammaproteobacteria bacterium]